MKRKNILTIIFTGCLLIFFNYISAPSYAGLGQKAEIQKKLCSLSKTENKELQALFDHFFYFSEFAYTIFGTKPMSIARLPPTLKAKKGWEAWEKIQGRFCSKKFILRKYLCDGYEFVLVANLKEIEKVYRENQAWFNAVFREKMTLDTLISCLKEESPLFQELMHNHLLVGILLGYGARNAELFSHNSTLENKKKIPLESFSMRVHPIFYLFSKIMPPNFACDPSTEETRDLKNRYQQERKEILKRAKKDSLFTQMLAEFRS